MNWLSRIKGFFHGAGNKPDAVELSSMDSFPASDPPGWISASVGSNCEEMTQIEQDNAAPQTAYRPKDVA